EDVKVYKDMRKRQIWVEPRFGAAKDWHGLRRCRLRGLWKVNCEGVPVAAGQNLKRWLSRTGGGGDTVPAAASPPPPAGSVSDGAATGPAANPPCPALFNGLARSATITGAGFAPRARRSGGGQTAARRAVAAMQMGGAVALREGKRGARPMRRPAR